MPSSASISGRSIIRRQMRSIAHESGGAFPTAHATATNKREPFLERLGIQLFHDESNFSHRSNRLR
jgi:hypothetical protein